VRERGSGTVIREPAMIPLHVSLTATCWNFACPIAIKIASGKGRGLDPPYDCRRAQPSTGQISSLSSSWRRPGSIRRIARFQDADRA
jgi:hypothetical protein